MEGGNDSHPYSITEMSTRFCSVNASILILRPDISARMKLCWSLSTDTFSQTPKGCFTGLTALPELQFLKT